MLAKFNGKKLKAIREARHITQETLAAQADLSDRYIRDLESGRRRNPSAALLFRLSKALDVLMEALMTGTMEDEGSSVS